MAWIDPQPLLAEGFPIQAGQGGWSLTDWVIL